MAIKASRGMKVLITRCCIYLIASLSCKVFESAFDVTSNHAKGTRQGGSVLDRVGTGLLVICLEKKKRKNNLSWDWSDVPSWITKWRQISVGIIFVWKIMLREASLFLVSLNPRYCRHFLPNTECDFFGIGTINKKFLHAARERLSFRLFRQGVSEMPRTWLRGTGSSVFEWFVRRGWSVTIFQPISQKTQTSSSAPPWGTDMLRLMRSFQLTPTWKGLKVKTLNSIWFRTELKLKL